MTPLTPLLPLGTHKPDGEALHRTTRDQIRAFSRAGLAAPIAALWQSLGHHAEALALSETAKIWPWWLLKSLAALDLHRAFVADFDRFGRPLALLGDFGRAQLALGDPASAQETLARAAATYSNRGPWLRAAATLASVDADRAHHHFQSRSHEPVAALLLAHLAERRADLDEAERLLSRATAKLGRVRETALLRANIATGRGNLHEAEVAARTGLRTPAATSIPRQDQPLVSIVVAAYRAAAGLDRTLHAILRQSWDNLEAIVVDDASGDDTRAVADRFAAKDTRVRVLSLPQNCGAYAARNEGMKIATGAFVLFQDAGDEPLADRVLLQAAPLLTNAISGTTSRLVRRDASGRFRNRLIMPLVRQYPGSFTLRRSLFDALGGFDKVRFGADGDLGLRLKTATGYRGWHEIDFPLSVFGYEPHSAVHDSNTGYGTRGFSPERAAYREASVRRAIDALKS